VRTELAPKRTFRFTHKRVFDAPTAAAPSHIHDERGMYRERTAHLCDESGADVYLGGAQSCRVQSSRVPTYVLFLHVTFTTSIPGETTASYEHNYEHTGGGGGKVC